jgi:hypothetical protein
MALSNGHLRYELLWELNFVSCLHVLLNKCCGAKIEEVDIGGCNVGRMWEKRNGYKVLVGKRGGNRPHVDLEWKIILK